MAKKASNVTLAQFLSDTWPDLQVSFIRKDTGAVVATVDLEKKHFKSNGMGYSMPGTSSKGSLEGEALQMGVNLSIIGSKDRNNADGIAPPVADTTVRTTVQAQTPADA